MRCGGGEARWSFPRRGRCRGSDTEGSGEGGRNAGFGTFERERERQTEQGPRGGQMK